MPLDDLSLRVPVTRARTRTLDITKLRAIAIPFGPYLGVRARIRLQLHTYIHLRERRKCGCGFKF